jgi:hypothetical protein
MPKQPSSRICFFYLLPSFQIFDKGAFLAIMQRVVLREFYTIFLNKPIGPKFKCQTQDY